MKTIIALVLLALVGCAEPSAPEPVTPPAKPAVTAPKPACPSFGTVTQVAGLSAAQGVTAHSCDSLISAPPSTLTLFDGQTMLGTVSAASGVVNGDSCTFTFALDRSFSDPGTPSAYECSTICTGCQQTCSWTTPTLSRSCSSATSYTVTVPAVSK